MLIFELLLTYFYMINYMNFVNIWIIINIIHIINYMFSFYVNYLIKKMQFKKLNYFCFIFI